VRFEDVHFAYEHDERSLLRGIDLDVRAGEMIAIVGPSGSGKTTLLSLLMRFEEPTQGVIRLDGTDLRELHQAGLRAKIGVVLQEPLLFNDTVRNNIAYGRRDAALEEIVAAARAANAHEFIIRLPEGYDTMLGEGGGRLSVGERQRITIARALVKDPPLILLDEATCSLDAESEATVQEALERLMAGRTTFVVAHRLATVVNADRILVLKDGRIVESGTHPELMRREGYYQSLVRRQTHRLLVNDGEFAVEVTPLPVLEQVA
jgi:ATP-binding cassette subfamily B protein